MSERIESWDIVRRRWQPDSHVWDGLDSIPIETVRNEVLDLCDGIEAMRQRAEAAEAKLARVDDYASYYAAAWELFEADENQPEPLDFDEWLAKQSKVQP